MPDGAHSLQVAKPGAEFKSGDLKMPYKEDAATAQLLRRHEKLIAPVQTLSELPLAVTGAHGPYLECADGREILDFISGACTMNLGYDPILPGHIGQFPFPYATGSVQLEYAQRLIALYPYGQAMLSYGISGSEGTDAAIKYARAYTGRRRIISFAGDYHGKSYGAMTLTSVFKGGSDYIGPMLPECRLLPFCGEDAQAEQVSAELSEIEAQGGEIAAVIFEAVQGDSGFLPLHCGFLEGLYELSRRMGFLMVSDESQLAFWRTGPFFSVENYPKVQADLIVMGKFLGGGIPLSAVIGRPEIMKSLRPLDHDFTFAGNAEACARGLKAFGITKTLQAHGRIAEIAKALEDFYAGLKRRHPQAVARLTGLGTARGLWLRSQDGREDDQTACFKVIYECFVRGLYTQRLGSSFLRLEPEYTLTNEQLQQAFGIIEGAIAALECGEIDDACLKWMRR